MRRMLRRAGGASLRWVLGVFLYRAEGAVLQVFLCFLFKKPALVPFLWIVGNIIPAVFIIIWIANDMIVKPGQPTPVLNVS